MYGHCWRDYRYASDGILHAGQHVSCAEPSYSGERRSVRRRAGHRPEDQR